MVNIVLEGPKASGKSTISNHFRNKGYEYFHSSASTKNDLDYHLNLLENKKKVNRVIDRFAVGEMIYPVIYDREPKMDWIKFVLTMMDRNTVYVILYSSDVEILMNRILERGRFTDDEEREMVRKSNEGFELIGKNFAYSNVLCFDITKISTKEIIKQVEKAIEEEI